ncbi:hypothetical protein ACOME3_010268 [Neoechinorhynchus agilis]
MSDKEPQAPKWTCFICTYENYAGTKRCAMCCVDQDGKCDAMKSAMPQSIQKWKCLQCTYLNHLCSSKCVMCLSSSKAFSSHIRRPPSRNEQAECGCPPKEEGDTNDTVLNKWRCSQCTYCNWPRSTRCLMCHLAKPKLVARSDSGLQLSSDEVWMNVCIDLLTMHDLRPARLYLENGNNQYRLLSHAESKLIGNELWTGFGLRMLARQVNVGKEMDILLRKTQIEHCLAHKYCLSWYNVHQGFERYIQRGHDFFPKLSKCLTFSIDYEILDDDLLLNAIVKCDHSHSPDAVLVQMKNREIGDGLFDAVLTLTFMAVLMYD